MRNGWGTSALIGSGMRIAEAAYRRRALGRRLAPPGSTRLELGEVSGAAPLASARRPRGEPLCAAEAVAAARGSEERRSAGAAACGSEERESASSADHLHAAVGDAPDGAIDAREDLALFTRELARRPAFLQRVDCSARRRSASVELRDLVAASPRARSAVRRSRRCPRVRQVGPSSAPWPAHAQT